MKQTCDRLVLGFILISFILGLALAASAFAFDYTSITFGQTSSAKTSAPNVRVEVGQKDLICQQIHSLLRSETL